MPIPARKLALVAIAFAGSLTAPSFHCLANDAVLSADRIGIPDAIPLANREMSELRGTGFLNGFAQGLFATGARTTVNALTGFIPTLLGVLPPGNTVSAQIGNQPIVTFNGTGPQSLSCGGAITCGPGTSFSLSSSTNPAAAHVSISFTLH